MNPEYVQNPGVVYICGDCGKFSQQPRAGIILLYWQRVIDIYRVNSRPWTLEITAHASDSCESGSVSSSCRRREHAEADRRNPLQRMWPQDTLQEEDEPGRPI